MKHIVKGAEPKSFQNWKKKKGKKSWNEFSGSRDKKISEIYRELRRMLIEHQEGRCCYCEIALEQETDAHVEHLKDKQKHARNIFDFQNLLAACEYNDCCGHKKCTGFFETMISPLNEDCEARFTYTRNGKIIPIDEEDTAAGETIELLGLNCKRLVNHRKTIIEMLDNNTTDCNFLQKSLEQCNEWYNGFYTVIQYIADKQGIKLSTHPK